MDNGDIVYNKNNEDPAHFILRLKSLKKALSDDDLAELFVVTVPQAIVYVNTTCVVNGKLLLFGQLATHQHTHHGGHHQTTGPAGAVAQAVKTTNVGIQIFIHLH